MNKNNPSSLPHFICIGVAPAFIAYILTKSEAVNPFLDICWNVQAAREKISSFLYDVYIIDLSLSEPSVFGLIQEIRKKEIKKIGNSSHFR